MRSWRSSPTQTPASFSETQPIYVLTEEYKKPLYMINAKSGVISEAAKAKIASDITTIHCSETGAPPAFVHAFFFEDAAHLPREDKAIVVLGRIRAGRSQDQKVAIITRIAESARRHSGTAPADIAVSISDTPASWAMEGGEIMPEPGEEAAWLAAHPEKAQVPDL